jgi:hypothetical protein
MQIPACAGMTGDLARRSDERTRAQEGKRKEKGRAG